MTRVTEVRAPFRMQFGATVCQLYLIGNMPYPATIYMVEKNETQQKLYKNSCGKHELS